MGLFEESIAKDMQDTEFAQGWREAEAELMAYYLSVTPEIVSAPDNMIAFACNKPATDSQFTNATIQPHAPYRGFVLR